MHRVLFTGMSGVGKSTLLQALKNDDNLTLDLDDGGWILFDLVYNEPAFDIARLLAFFADHPDQDIFLCGTAANQGLLYPHLTAVITLTAPLEVMHQRIISRRDNPFGQWPEEWAQIVRDKREIEPLLMAGSDYVCNTDRDWQAVVQDVQDYLHQKKSTVCESLQL